ncbi:DDE_3 domain-containing protein [Trichonephila clavipes]|nr:DDE_3 domain-containing protein [Trichonephila clavipes]
MLGQQIAARQPPPICLLELRRALLDEWCNIPQDQIDNLILSMPRRLKYLTDAEIQELLAQSDGELSDIDDPDFENIPESDTDSKHLENDSLVYEEIEQPFPHQK